MCGGTDTSAVGGTVGSCSRGTKTSATVRLGVLSSTNTASTGGVTCSAETVRVNPRVGLVQRVRVVRTSRV